MINQTEKFAFCHQKSIGKKGKKKRKNESKKVRARSSGGSWWKVVNIVAAALCWSWEREEGMKANKVCTLFVAFIFHRRRTQSHSHPRDLLRQTTTNTYWHSLRVVVVPQISFFSSSSSLSIQPPWGGQRREIWILNFNFICKTSWRSERMRKATTLSFLQIFKQQIPLLCITEWDFVLNEARTRAICWFTSRIKNVREFYAWKWVEGRNVSSRLASSQRTYKCWRWNLW